jgi:uncharacterized phage protein gp47/JayE
VRLLPAAGNGADIVANGCVILRPEPQALFNRLRDAFSSTVLGGGKVIPESNEWYVITNDYAMAESFYAIADQMWRETNPETACCDNLYAMAARDGVFPYVATFAQGYAKLTGTPGAAVPVYFEVQTSVGIYASTGSVPLTIETDGTAIVRIQAITPGSEMNATGNVTEGTLLTPAPGINDEVEICGGQFCGGAEAEDCEAFRKRYLDRLAYKPRPTMSWIKEELLKFPCATRVCVREGTCCRCDPKCTECGCANCGNRMEFYVFFDESFPCGIPPQNIVDDITDWLFGVHQGYGEGQVEIGVCGQIYRPKPLMVNVIIDIEGCPTISQKQQIQNDVAALFKRVCPSMPLRVKQIELIIASIMGPDINAGAYFEVVSPKPYDNSMVYIAPCGDLEMGCDWVPCLNEVKFAVPEAVTQPC